MTEVQGVEPAPGHDVTDEVSSPGSEIPRTPKRGEQDSLPIHPDLVFGLVRTMGSEWSALRQQLERNLAECGYLLSHIKLSNGLAANGPYKSDAERYEALMDAGDKFRDTCRLAHAVAAKGIEQIREVRSGNGEARHAFLVDKLVHPDEIEALRAAYGSRLFVIGCDSPRVARVENIKARFVESGMDGDEAYQAAVHVVNREAGEGVSKNEAVAGLQRRYRVAVGRALEKADVFTRGDDPEHTRRIIERLVQCIFGDPFRTPTLDELGMALAYQAALTTATLSRRVGAAIMLNEQIVGVGSNEVPKFHGGTYHEESQKTGVDGREYQYGKDPSDRFRIDMLADLLARLRSPDIGWTPPSDGTSSVSPRELAIEIANKVSGCKLLDVIEYTRTAHAEMVAITAAARLGISIAGATLFTTTFPCHECTSNIIAAGIERVVYLEPYEKSKGPDLHPDAVYAGAHSEGSPGKLAYEPFAGFVYWRFHELFSWVPRKRDDQIKKGQVGDSATSLRFDGQAVVWKPQSALVRSSIFSQAYAQAELLKQTSIEEQILAQLDSN